MYPRPHTVHALVERTGNMAKEGHDIKKGQQELTLLKAEKTLNLNHSGFKKLSFRSSTQYLCEPDNGSFLKEVELKATYDPVVDNQR